jgi:5-formyltetrahydrofolate cyclo-ligase
MSRQIVEKLIVLPVFRGHNQFFIYCSYQSEVETLALLHHCLREGKSVSVPLALPQRFELLAVQIKDPSTDLSPGYKGIPEPISSLAELQNIHPQSIEIAVIPGVVFDRSGVL